MIELIIIFLIVYILYFIDRYTDFFADGRTLTLYVDGKEEKYEYVTYSNKLLYVKNSKGELKVLKEWVVLGKESLLHYLVLKSWKM